MSEAKRKPSNNDKGEETVENLTLSAFSMVKLFLVVSFLSLGTEKYLLN